MASRVNRILETGLRQLVQRETHLLAMGLYGREILREKRVQGLMNLNRVDTM